MYIPDVLELMGCKEHESSVRRLPHIDARCQLSETDIDAAAVQRIENIFLRSMKLPNLQLKCDNDLKIVCSIKSMTRQLIAGQATDEIEIDDEDHVPSVATPIDIGMLSIMPNTIRDVLQHEWQYTSLDARKLPVPLSNVPTEYT